MRLLGYDRKYLFVSFAFFDWIFLIGHFCHHLYVSCSTQCNPKLVTYIMSVSSDQCSFIPTSCRHYVYISLPSSLGSDQAISNRTTSICYELIKDILHLRLQLFIFFSILNRSGPVGRRFFIASPLSSNGSITWLDW